MHKFYLTNNLGGGGTNVSRFTVYQGVLSNCSEIGLLLNYYYLNTDIKKDHAFDGDILKYYKDYNLIIKFLDHIRCHFISKGRIVTGTEIDIKSTPIDSYLLDSGIGNLLRDLILKNSFNTKSVDELIEPYHKYGEGLNFNILIALDYALKYTYKKGERLDTNLKVIWGELVNNQTGNLLLLEQTLKHLKTNNYKHKVYAPLHGFNFDSFLKYGEGILKLEEENNTLFDGYALGGIANTKDLKDEIWGVPKGLNKNQKSTWIVSNLCNQTSYQFKKKPLHVLGAGNIYALPFLTYFGATSSDCHSPWRRASDGDSKILIPLFDEKLNFINTKNVFEYIILEAINENDYQISLPLNMSLQELKRLYNSTNNEEYYLSQLIMFFHAISQYDLLIKFINNNKRDYLEKLCKTNDKRFNAEYVYLCELLIE